MLAALEAGSGALRSVEAAAGLAADQGEAERLQAGLHRALDLLRAALDELPSPAGASPVSGGFVLPAPATANPGASEPDRETPPKAAVAEVGRR